MFGKRSINFILSIIIVCKSTISIIVMNLAVCSFPPFPCPPCLAVDPAQLKENRFYFTNSWEMKLINQDIERCSPLLPGLQTPLFSRVFQNMKKYCTRHYLFKNFKNSPSCKRECLVLPLDVYTVNLALKALSFIMLLFLSSAVLLGLSRNVLFSFVNTCNTWKS